MEVFGRVLPGFGQLRDVRCAGEKADVESPEPLPLTGRKPSTTGFIRGHRRQVRQFSAESFP